uniref:glutathione transferase n=1 Tax=Oryza brachyantha TaxID=4533 RepID=J3L218_ORYBR
MSTSVARVVVCLEEVGAEYERVDIDFAAKEHRASPDHLNRNPFGQFPAFQDGDLLLLESRAIGRYILRKYKTGDVDLLREGNPRDAAMVDMATEVEAHQYTPAISPIVYECIFHPAMRGTPASTKVVDESLEKLRKVLEVYEARLGGGAPPPRLSYFPFTFYFMVTPYAPLFDEYPRVKGWWERLAARPSVRKLAAGMAISPEAIRRSFNG